MPSQTESTLQAERPPAPGQTPAAPPRLDDDAVGEPMLDREGHARARYAGVVVAVSLAVTLGVVLLRRLSKVRSHHQPLLGLMGSIAGGRPPLRLRWHRRRYLLGARFPRTSVAGLLSSLRRPHPPRVLPYVVVKRSSPRLGDTYGHWWVEIDAAESYGWWPQRGLRLRDYVFGTVGTLNGLGGKIRGGTLTTDPHHLDRAEHSFHPTLVARKSDRRVRAELRRFALGYTGEWRWSPRARPGDKNCRSFQLGLLEAAGLSDNDHLFTRGRGCPFLYPFRRARRRLRAVRPVIRPRRSRLR